MMEIALGFLIALAVGLTGVGAGSVTAPALMIFLHVPAAPAVGTALIFGAITKFIAAPSYLLRKQVNFRVLGWMLLGGLPGAIIGSLTLDRMKHTEHNALLYGSLGVLIAVCAGLNLWRLLVKPNPNPKSHRDRARWLSLIALPIGAEVGFSSAGAGALGTIALMNLTTLASAQVVGTDMMYGLGLSVVGGGLHFTAGNFDTGLLFRLLGGGVFGVLLGANLSAILPSRPLRVAISLWLVSLGGELCWRALTA
ncbi:MAG: sulfite exporter TauE/SafE family protein [Bryobacteraceae bacterium]